MPSGGIGPGESGRQWGLGGLLILLQRLRNAGKSAYLDPSPSLDAMTLPALRGALAAALGVALAAAAGAQSGGFETLDPAYGGETARRGFYGGFALSGEAAYQDADIGATGAASGSNLSLSARLDYALLPQVDLALVADLTGGVQDGPLGLSWVVVKPYWHNEMTDYAVRVAIDPANEGGLGFRQTDVTFLSTTSLSPVVTSDLSVGLRRVRTGYTPLGEEDLPGATEPTTEALYMARVILTEPTERARLVGQEIRGSWGYNVLFDPAGSRFALGLVAEAGDYAIVRTRLNVDPLAAGDGAVAEETGSDRIRVGTGWIRAGMEFSRPSYQVAPFVSLPVVRWSDKEVGPELEGPRVQRFKFGLRLTLR